jgi:hypothetical protein
MLVRIETQALSNGLRSDVEIATTTRLALDRVHIALSVLVRHQCVVGSSCTLFRLTDNGKDMVKNANAAERQHQGLRPFVPRVPQGYVPRPPVVLSAPPGFRDDGLMPRPATFDEPSPAPWVLPPGGPPWRVISSHFPVANGPLLEQAPAMVDLLRELVAGASAEELRTRAALILRHIDRRAPREPGEDDE